MWLRCSQRRENTVTVAMRLFFVIQALIVLYVGYTQCNWIDGDFGGRGYVGNFNFPVNAGAVACNIDDDEFLEIIVPRATPYILERRPWNSMNFDIKPTTTLTNIPVGNWSGPALCNDFDKDGHADLLFTTVTNTASAIILRGPFPFTVYQYWSIFNFNQSLPSGSPSTANCYPASAAFIDVNCDSHLDILFSFKDCSIVPQIYSPSMNFVPTPSYSNISISGENGDVISTVDIDNNGYTDIVFRSIDGHKNLYMANASSTLHYDVYNLNFTSNHNTQTGVMCIGDFYRRSKVDVVLSGEANHPLNPFVDTSTFPRLFVSTNDIEVWQRTDVNPMFNESGYFITDLVCLDFDNDGYIDILRYDNSGFYAFKNQLESTGNFRFSDSRVVNYPVPQDFNNDGISDNLEMVNPASIIPIDYDLDGDIDFLFLENMRQMFGLTNNINQCSYSCTSGSPAYAERILDARNGGVLYGCTATCTDPCKSLLIKPITNSGSYLTNAKVTISTSNGVLGFASQTMFGGGGATRQTYEPLHFGVRSWNSAVDDLIVQIAPGCGGTVKTQIICPGELQCAAQSSYILTINYDQMDSVVGNCLDMEMVFVMTNPFVQQEFDFMSVLDSRFGPMFDPFSLEIVSYCFDSECDQEKTWAQILSLLSKKRMPSGVILVPGAGQPPREVFLNYEVCQTLAPSACFSGMALIQITPACNSTPSVCSSLADVCGTGTCDPMNVNSDNYGCVYTPSASPSTPCSVNNYTCVQGFCGDGKCVAEYNDAFCFMDVCTQGVCDPFSVTGNVTSDGCGLAIADGDPCRDNSFNLTRSEPCWGSCVCMSGQPMYSGFNDTVCQTDNVCWDEGVCSDLQDEYFLEPIAILSQETGQRGNYINRPPISSFSAIEELAFITAHFHDQFGYQVEVLDTDILVSDPLAYRTRTSMIAGLFINGTNDPFNPNFNAWYVEYALPGAVWVYMDRGDNTPAFEPVKKICIDETGLPFPDNELFMNITSVTPVNVNDNPYNLWRPCTGMAAWEDFTNGKQWLACFGATTNVTTFTSSPFQFGDVSNPFAPPNTLIVFERDPLSGNYTINTVLTVSSGTLFPFVRNSIRYYSTSALTAYNDRIVFTPLFGPANSTSGSGYCNFWYVVAYNSTANNWYNYYFPPNSGMFGIPECSSGSNGIFGRPPSEDVYDFANAGIRTALWGNIAVQGDTSSLIWGDNQASVSVWDVTPSPPVFIHRIIMGEDNIGFGTASYFNATRYIMCSNDGFLVVARLCEHAESDIYDCLWAYKWNGTAYANEQELVVSHSDFLTSNPVLTYRYTSCDVDANRIVASLMSFNDDDDASVPYVEYYHRSSILSESNNHFGFVKRFRYDRTRSPIPEAIVDDDAFTDSSETYVTYMNSAFAPSFGQDVALGHGDLNEFAFIGNPIVSQRISNTQGTVAAICLDFQNSCTRGCSSSFNDGELCQPYLMETCYIDGILDEEGLLTPNKDYNDFAATCFHGDCRTGSRNATIRPKDMAVDSYCCYSFCDTYIDHVEMLAPLGTGCIPDVPETGPCVYDDAFGCEDFRCNPDLGGICERTGFREGGVCVTETDAGSGTCDDGGNCDFNSGCTQFGYLSDEAFFAQAEEPPYVAQYNETEFPVTFGRCVLACVISRAFDFIDLPEPLLCPNCFPCHDDCLRDCVCTNDTQCEHFPDRPCVEPVCYEEQCVYSYSPPGTACNASQFSANPACTGSAGTCDARGNCIPDTFVEPERSCTDVCGFSACNDGLWYTDYDKCTGYGTCEGIPNAYITYFSQDSYEFNSLLDNNIATTERFSCATSIECMGAMEIACQGEEYTGFGPSSSFSAIIPGTGDYFHCIFRAAVETPGIGFGSYYPCSGDICNTGELGQCIEHSATCNITMGPINPICESVTRGCNRTLVIAINPYTTFYQATLQNFLQNTVVNTFMGTNIAVSLVSFGPAAFTVCSYTNFNTMMEVDAWVNCTEALYDLNTVMFGIQALTIYADISKSLSIVDASVYKPDNVLVIYDGQSNLNRDAFAYYTDALEAEGTDVSLLCNNPTLDTSRRCVLGSSSKFNNVSFYYGPTADELDSAFIQFVNERNVTGCGEINIQCQMLVYDPVTCECTPVADPGAVGETCVIGEQCIRNGTCDATGQCVPSGLEPDGTPCFTEDPPPPCASGTCQNGTCVYDLNTVVPEECEAIEAIDDKFELTSLAPNGTFLFVLDNDIGPVDASTLQELTPPTPFGSLVVNMGAFQLFDIPSGPKPNITFNYTVCNVFTSECDNATVCVFFDLVTLCEVDMFNCSSIPTEPCIDEYICSPGALADSNGCSPNFTASGTPCNPGYTDCASRLCDGMGNCLVDSVNSTQCQSSWPCLQGSCTGVEAANYSAEVVGVVKCPTFTPGDLEDYNQTSMFLTTTVYDDFLFWGETDDQRSIGRVSIYRRVATSPIHYEFLQVIGGSDFQPSYLGSKPHKPAVTRAINGDLLATVVRDPSTVAGYSSFGCDFVFEDFRYNSTAEVWESLGIFGNVSIPEWTCQNNPMAPCELHRVLSSDNYNVILMTCNPGASFEYLYLYRDYNGMTYDFVTSVSVVDFNTLSDFTPGDADIWNNTLAVSYSGVNSGNDTDFILFSESTPQQLLVSDATNISTSGNRTYRLRPGWPALCMTESFLIHNVDLSPFNSNSTSASSPMESFVLYPILSHVPLNIGSPSYYTVPDSALFQNTSRSQFSCDARGNTILIGQHWSTVGGYLALYEYDTTSQTAHLRDVFGEHINLDSAFREPSFTVHLDSDLNPDYAYSVNTFNNMDSMITYTSDLSDRINIYCIDEDSICTNGCDDIFSADGLSCDDMILGTEDTVCMSGFCVGNDTTASAANITECTENIASPLCYNITVSPCFGCQYEQKMDGQVRGPGVDIFCQTIFCTDGIENITSTNDSLCVNAPGLCYTGVCDPDNSMSPDGCVYTPSSPGNACFPPNQASCESSFCSVDGICLLGQNNTCNDNNDCTWDVCDEPTDACIFYVLSHDGGLTNIFYSDPTAPSPFIGGGSLPFRGTWTVPASWARIDGIGGFEGSVAAPFESPFVIDVSTHRVLSIDLNRTNVLVFNVEIFESSTQPTDNAFRNTYIAGVRVTDGVGVIDTPYACLEIYTSNFDYSMSSNVTSCLSLQPSIAAYQALEYNVTTGLTSETLSFIVNSQNLTVASSSIYISYFPAVQGTDTLDVDVRLEAYIEAVLPEGCEGDFNCSVVNVCEAGTCSPGIPPDCYVPDQCQVGYCNSSTNACDVYVVPEGTACQDGDPCSTNDTCLFNGTQVVCTAEIGCPHVEDICGYTSCDPGIIVSNENVTVDFLPDEFTQRYPGVAVDTYGTTISFAFVYNQINIICMPVSGIEPTNPINLQQTISATNHTSDSRYGKDVSMSKDGQVIAVGAPGDVQEVVGYNYSPQTYPYPNGLPPLYANRSGSVEIVMKTSEPQDFSDCTYEFAQKLQPIDLRHDSQMGWSVSVSDNGDIVAIGGPGHNNGEGAVWIYIRNPVTGLFYQSPPGRLVFSNVTGPQSMIGTSVDLSVDGTYLAVGAPGDDNNRGAVWIFAGTSASSAWTQVGTKLVGSPSPGFPSEEQGRSVALSSNGLELAVGGSGDTYFGMPGVDSGAVWIWMRTSAVTYVEQQMLLPSVEFNLGGSASGSAVGNFGHSIDLSDDGDLLLVSGSETNSTDVDPVSRTLLYYKPNLSTNFVPTEAGIDVGFEVEIAGNGDSAIVGSYRNITLAFIRFGQESCVEITVPGSCETQETMDHQCITGTCTGAYNECVHQFNDTVCTPFIGGCVANAFCTNDTNASDDYDPVTGCAFTYEPDFTGCDGLPGNECDDSFCMNGACTPNSNTSLCSDIICQVPTCDTNGFCVYNNSPLWTPCNEFGYQCTPGYCNIDGICVTVLNQTFCDDASCLGGVCDPLSSPPGESGCTIEQIDGFSCVLVSSPCYGASTCVNQTCVPSVPFDSSVCTPDPLDQCVTSGNCTGWNDYLTHIHTLSPQSQFTGLRSQQFPVAPDVFTVLGNYIFFASNNAAYQLDRVVKYDDMGIAYQVEIFVHERVTGFQPPEWGLSYTTGRPTGLDLCLDSIPVTLPVSMETTTTSDSRQWVLLAHGGVQGLQNDTLNPTTNETLLRYWDVDFYEHLPSGETIWRQRITPSNAINSCGAPEFLEAKGDWVTVGLIQYCINDLTLPFTDNGGSCDPLNLITYDPMSQLWGLSTEFDCTTCLGGKCPVSSASATPATECGTPIRLIGSTAFVAIFPYQYDPVTYGTPALSDGFLIFDIPMTFSANYVDFQSYTSITNSSMVSLFGPYSAPLVQNCGMLVQSTESPDEMYAVEYGNSSNSAVSPVYYDAVTDRWLAPRVVVITWNGTNLTLKERLTPMPLEQFTPTPASDPDITIDYLYVSGLTVSQNSVFYSITPILNGSYALTANAVQIFAENTYNLFFKRTSSSQPFDYIANLRVSDGASMYPYTNFDSTSNGGSDGFLSDPNVNTNLYLTDTFAFVGTGSITGELIDAREIFVYCIEPTGCNRGCEYTYETDFLPCEIFPAVPCMNTSACFQGECQSIGVQAGDPALIEEVCRDPSDEFCNRTLCFEYVGCMSSCYTLFEEEQCNATYTCISNATCVVDMCVPEDANNECDLLDTECEDYSCDVTLTSPPGVNATSGCFLETQFNSSTSCTPLYPCELTAVCNGMGGCEADTINQTVCDTYAQTVGGLCNYAVCDRNDGNVDPSTGCVLLSNDTYCEVVHVGECVQSPFCNNTDPSRNMTDSCVLPPANEGDACFLPEDGCVTGVCMNSSCVEFNNNTICEQMFGDNQCLNNTFCDPSLSTQPHNCVLNNVTNATPCNTTSNECEQSECIDGECQFGTNDTLCIPSFNCQVPVCLPDATCSYVNDDNLCSIYETQCTTSVCDPNNENEDPGSGCFSTNLPVGTSCNITGMNPNSCEFGSQCNVSGICELGIDPGLCVSTQCMNSTCDVNLGICFDQIEMDGTPCDEDNATCSVDQCMSGMCVFQSLNHTDCEFLDSEPCVDNGVCDPMNRNPGDTTTGCRSNFSSPDTPCTITGGDCEQSVCLAGGVCDIRGNASLCDDGEECTDNLCINTLCEYPSVADGTLCGMMTGKQACLSGDCLMVIDCSDDVISIPAYRNATFDISNNDLNIDECFFDVSGAGFVSFTGSISQPTPSSCELDISRAQCDFSVYNLTYAACNSSLSICCPCNIYLCPQPLPTIIANDDNTTAQSMMTNFVDLISNDNIIVNTTDPEPICSVTCPNTPCARGVIRDGVCTYEQLEDGTSCTTGSICWENGMCVDGVCNEQAVDVDALCPMPPDQCQQYVCEDPNLCVLTHEMDGTTCNDGIACTGVDTCLNGFCLGTPTSCDSTLSSSLQNNFDTLYCGLEIVSTIPSPSPGALATRGVFAFIDMRYAISVTQSTTDTIVFTIDFINPTMPVYVEQLSLTGGGLITIQPTDRYLYIVTIASGDYFLYIIDITNPTSYSILSTTMITGPVSQTTVNEQETVFYYAANSMTLGVVDITDKTSPILLTPFSTGGIIVSGMKSTGVYLFTVSFIDNTVSVFDITIPSTPVLVTQATDPGPLRFYFLLDIYPERDLLVASSPSTPYIASFDIFNPPFTTHTGTYPVSDNSYVLSKVNFYDRFVYYQDVNGVMNTFNINPDRSLTLECTHPPGHPVPPGDQRIAVITEGYYIGAVANTMDSIYLSCPGNASSPCAPLSVTLNADHYCYVSKCNETLGACENITAPIGTPCEDNDPCTASSFCDGEMCVSSGINPCVDPSNPCTADAICISGQCDFTPNNNDPCDFDGDRSACSFGYCTNNTTPSCDDFNPCTNDVGIVQIGVRCFHTPINVGQPCDDGRFCTVNGTCLSNGECRSFLRSDCTTDDCNIGTCIVGSDSCNTTAISDSPCNITSGCSMSMCNSGVCEAMGSNCSSLDSECTVGQCFDFNAMCVPVGLTGSPCTPLSACVLSSICTGDGRCEAVEEVNCVNASNPCTVDAVCNPVSGDCIYPNIGDACDDGISCSYDSTCLAQPSGEPICGGGNFEFCPSSMDLLLDILPCNDTYPCDFPWGQVNLLSNNTVEVTINNNSSCLATAIYDLCDNSTCDNCGQATLNINIFPLAMNDTATSVTSQPASVSVLDNDKGQITDCFINSTGLPMGWTASLNTSTNCTATLQPANCETGTYTLEYTICTCPDQSLCDTATVQFTIEDSLPVTAVDDGAVTLEDTSTTINVVANDLGPVDTSTITILTPPVNGSIDVIDLITGVITYTPNMTFTGIDTFVYQICDQPGECYCSNATVSVLVAETLTNYIARDDCYEGFTNMTITGFPLINDGPPAADPSTFIIIQSSPDGSSVFNATSEEFIFAVYNTFFSGTTYVDYAVCSSVDPGSCATATIKIYIIPYTVPLEPRGCAEGRVMLVHGFEGNVCSSDFFV